MLLVSNIVGFSILLVDVVFFIGEFYTNRVYRGLDQRIGEEAPSVLEQGRTGIASGYDDDHRS